MEENGAEPGLPDHGAPCTRQWQWGVKNPKKWKGNTCSLVSTTRSGGMRKGRGGEVQGGVQNKHSSRRKGNDTW